MKIQNISTKMICSNPNSIHNFFGWPSVAKLKDGRLAMVASGFRLRHICPFGKGIICFSSDNGGTWTAPAIIIDTPFDDRDCGITSFGKSGVVVTSFNNTIEFQRNQIGKPWNLPFESNEDYINAYLDEVQKRNIGEELLGSLMVVSNDNGNTFGKIMKVPVSSPHGPCILENECFLYVGTYHSGNYSKKIGCFRLHPDGKYEHICDIKNEDEDALYCEPHAIVTKSGKVVVHIRVEKDGKYFIYQCATNDLTKGFSEPYKILSLQGGSAAHLLQISDGTLISTYGSREKPFGIRALISYDDGETWGEENTIYKIPFDNSDMGYPCSVELEDGNILTVFYMHCEDGEKKGPAVIMQTIWKIEK